MEDSKKRKADAASDRPSKKSMVSVPPISNRSGWADGLQTSNCHSWREGTNGMIELEGVNIIVVLVS